MKILNLVLLMSLLVCIVGCEAKPTNWELVGWVQDVRIVPRGLTSHYSQILTTQGIFLVVGIVVDCDFGARVEVSGYKLRILSVQHPGIDRVYTLAEY